MRKERKGEKEKRVRRGKERKEKEIIPTTFKIKKARKRMQEKGK